MDLVVRILNFSIMILAPVALGVFLVQRYRTRWGLFATGMVTFILSQVLHIPFNNWVLTPLAEKAGFMQPEGTLEILAFSLVFSLSAGVFEEPARYLVLKFWAKDARTWKDGMMFGAGHGGIEAMIAGGLAMYGFIQALTLKDADLNLVLPPEQVDLAAAQLAQYWSIPWHTALLGAMERLAAITFHLSASLLVMRSLVKKQIRWLFYAIGWHTIFNLAALTCMYLWGMNASIASVVILGVASLGIILALKDKISATELPGGIEENLPMIEILQQEPTEDNLEDSRYA